MNTMARQDFTVGISIDEDNEIPKSSAKKGFLRKVFNVRNMTDFALGAGTSWGLSTVSRAGILSAAAAAGVGTFPAVLIAAAGTSAVMSVYRHRKDYNKDKAVALLEGREIEGMFEGANWTKFKKKLLVSTMFSTIGGGVVFNHLHHDQVAAFGHSAMKFSRDLGINDFVSKTTAPVVEKLNEWGVTDWTAKNSAKAIGWASKHLAPVTSWVSEQTRSPLAWLSQKTTAIADYAKSAVVKTITAAEQAKDYVVDTGKNIVSSTNHFIARARAAYPGIKDSSEKATKFYADLLDGKKHDAFKMPARPVSVMPKTIVLADNPSISPVHVVHTVPVKPYVDPQIVAAKPVTSMIEKFGPAQSPFGTVANFEDRFNALTTIKPSFDNITGMPAKDLPLTLGVKLPQATDQQVSWENFADRMNEQPKPALQTPSGASVVQTSTQKITAQNFYDRLNQTPKPAPQTLGGVPLQEQPLNLPAKPVLAQGFDPAKVETYTPAVQEAPTVTPDVAAITPVPALPQATWQDKLQHHFEGQHLRPRTQALIDRVMNGDAQSQKDLAVKLINGQGGFVKDTDLGLALYRDAAAQGNTQARIDLAYGKLHGLWGMTADRQGAMEELDAITKKSSRARSMLNELKGIVAEPKVPHHAANSVTEAVRPAHQPAKLPSVKVSTHAYVDPQVVHAPVTKHIPTPIARPSGISNTTLGCKFTNITEDGNTVLGSCKAPEGAFKIGQKFKMPSL